MRRHPEWAVLLCLVIGQAVCVAQVDVQLAAPPLGQDRYTVNIAAPLRDAVEELRKVTGRYISLPPGKPPDATEGVDLDAPVVLEFTDAPLGEIMLSLCRQTGTVYSGAQGGQFLSLHPGDVGVDGRPTTVLEGYLVRVKGWQIGQSRSMAFAWGSPAPEEPTYADWLNIDLEIVPRTPEADRLLAGVASGMVAVLEGGERLEQAQSGMPYTPRHMGFGDTGAFETQARLPVPVSTASEMFRLEGALCLYSELREVSLDVPAQAAAERSGQGASAKVTSANLAPAGPIVGIELTYAPLKLNQVYMHLRRDEVSASLVAADGTTVRNRGHEARISSYTMQECTGQYTFRFGALPEGFEVDHLRLSISLRGDPDKRVPFAISHIPLGE